MIFVQKNYIFTTKFTKNTKKNQENYGIFPDFFEFISGLRVLRG